MKLKIIPVVLTAAITSIATVFIAGKFQDNHTIVQEQRTLPVNYAKYTDNTVSAAAPIDFEAAAEASVNAVVHIKTQKKGKSVIAQDPRFGDDFFGQLFGRRQYYIPPQMGSGSGVVISENGYIVTNNHVISGADEVTVTFNDRYTADAKLVATDPSTDIAILKVEEKNLPYMEFGNSDDVKLGQWVLAVGYPLTLDATVTAGIVSAKGRALGINRRQSSLPVESFIQTDAAVNPGNSGGALVNTSGQLIGVNSAIASPTGSYAGYSYAIPANIVRKIADDLIEYGSVQRAYLGINYVDRKHASQEMVTDLKLDKESGVYVARVLENSGAEKAGLKEGDFIVDINGATINTSPELQEQIARFKPGDNISVGYVRDGKKKVTSVELRNINGTTEIIKKPEISKMLGGQFRAINNVEKDKYGLKNGVVVTDVGNGILAKQTNMPKGFIILSVNDVAVNTPADVQEIIANSDNVKIAGMVPGNKAMFYYGITNLKNLQRLEQ